jgi:hypothetical protein
MPQQIIPIWPGSSSYSPGLTPFGFYDTDTEFTSSADKVAKWCAERLGYPIVNIELQDINFYAAFEEAITEYSNQVNQFNIRENMLNLQGASLNINLSQRVISNNLDRVIQLSSEYGVESGYGGNVTYKSASLQLTAGIQEYNLSSALQLESTDQWGDIEIKKIHHYAPPAIVKYFDPFVGTGMGSQQMLEQFGWGAYSPGVSFMMMPIYADLLRLQAIEFNDQIRRSAYGFELHNNRLRILPIPTTNLTLWFQYIVKADRGNPLKFPTGSISDFSNVPYNRITYSDINHPGRQWILYYTLALVKETLGYVRTKYSSIPIPNAETTLNGDALLSAAQSEKESLINQLRENLEATSRSVQITKQSDEASQLQTQLNKIPLSIYVF